MADAIEEKVRKIIAEQLQKDPLALKLEDSFIENLEADSLDIVELVMAMEDEFSMDIPDEAAEKIQTVRDAIDYIKNNAKA